jgi:hypothetical protein
MGRIILLAMMLSLPFINISAQSDNASVQILRSNGQHSFSASVPHGNYSGIAHLYGNVYAMVDDKSEKDGFHLFAIDVDSLSGDIADVRHLGFRSSMLPNRDGEGIVFIGADSTIIISGEADSRLMEYNLNGGLTGRSYQLPPITDNYGYESLGYDRERGLLWTCNESTMNGDGIQATSVNGAVNRLRLRSYNLNPRSVQGAELISGSDSHSYLYEMDKPMAHVVAWKYVYGVSEVMPMENGSVLVLEREFFVPKKKLGAWCNCKIYQVFPDESSVIRNGDLQTAVPLRKHLVYEWRTKLSLLNHEIANYEGMCLGPRLKDGSRIIILVADSQNHYGGVLKDYFKSIVISR